MLNCEEQLLIVHRAWMTPEGDFMLLNLIALDNLAQGINLVWPKQKQRFFNKTLYLYITITKEIHKAIPIPISVLYCYFLASMICLTILLSV